MADSRLFVVRIWSEAKRFRASARAVEREETQFFDTPEALMRFLDGGEPTAPAAEHDFHHHHHCHKEKDQ
jgi:hypothetical protein